MPKATWRAASGWSAGGLRELVALLGGELVMGLVGSKDNVKEGYRLTIYRGGMYKGKVQVESVYPTMCSARILTDLMANEQKIEEGDSASTRVY